MSRIFSKYFVFFALIAGFSLIPAVGANALIGTGAKSEACKGVELNSKSGDDCGDEAAQTTQTIIQRVINILSAVGAVMAVIVIIVNGIRLVLSNGDSSRVNTARTGIIMALVGLVIIAVAQAIVRFVVNKVA